MTDENFFMVVLPRLFIVIPALILYYMIRKEEIEKIKKDKYYKKQDKYKFNKIKKKDKKK